ncbi:MAG: DUF5711 family protein [Oscillospiraceae bacterium]|jgi:hypothetical protein|nr:DUF5711 family protein [Oscillospiraceae bacterium]
MKKAQSTKKHNPKHVRALIFAAFALIFCALLVPTLLSVPNGGLAALFARPVNEGYPHSLEGQSPLEMLPAENGVEILGVDSVTQLDKKAREVYSRKLDYADPIASSAYGCTFVADRADGRYFLHDKKGIIFEGNARSPITLVSAGQKNAALASQTAAGETRLDVLNPSGSITFSWSNAGERIVSVTLSSNGRYAAVVLLRMEEGERYSRAIIFDIKKQKAAAEVDFGQGAMLRARFTDKNRLCILGENILTYLKTDGSRAVEDTELIAGQLERFTFSQEGRTALVLRSEGNRSSLQVFDAQGEPEFEKPVEAVASLAFDGKNIAVLQANSLEVYDKGGAVIGRLNTITDPIVSIILDGKSVYAQTNKNIERFTF